LSSFRRSRLPCVYIEKWTWSNHEKDAVYSHWYCCNRNVRDAGVGHLLCYHIVPPMMFLGQDGVVFSLPANSDEIIQTSEGL
jgi:hypothetical protein